MQRGSLARVSRKEGPLVWQFRWSEKNLHGARVQRKKVIGTVVRYPDENAARTAMAVFLAELNSEKVRMGSRSITFILFYRGFGEFHQKNFDRAEKDFDRAYELDPTLYAGIGKALSDFIHANKQEGPDRLRGLEEKIIEHGVGDPEATYKIAQAYAVLGDRASSAART